MSSLPNVRSLSLVPAFMRRGTKFYDLAAGAPLILFYGLSATGKVHALAAALFAFSFAQATYMSVLTILSDIVLLGVASLFVLFILLRPPAVARSAGLMPRVAAVAGGYLAVALLLTSPEKVSGTLLTTSMVMILCGTAFAVYAIAYLGRSVSLLAEARKLVTGGPYRLVRHPLYLGEEIAIAGVVLQHFSLFALLVFAVQLSFQFYRMSCEEKVLAGAFAEYDAYAQRTYKIVPGVY